MIFQKLLIVPTYGFHQRVSRSILSNIARRYSFWMEYMRRTMSRKDTASPWSAKSPEGKLGQWPWLILDSIKMHYNMSMWKISHIFSLRTSRKPQNRHSSHYWYVWGHPRSMTSDDLRMVYMQCQRSHVVMFWPKSCIISPFLLMAADYVSETTISWKNRSEAVPLMTS